MHRLSVAVALAVLLFTSAAPAADVRLTQLPSPPTCQLPAPAPADATAQCRVSPAWIPASSFAWDIEGAGWDEACWNDGTGQFEEMLTRLRELDLKTKDPLNQVRDILIAETAIKNCATLGHQGSQFAAGRLRVRRSRHG
jgi:hypothetical protein